MPGSRLSSALLHLCPGLGCTRGRIRAFIPAIYLHSGRVAGFPVDLTIDGPGLTMTKNRALFLSPKLWPSFYPWLLACVLRAPSLAPGSLAKRDLFLFPMFWGLFRVTRFFWGSGCGGTFPSLSPVPYPLSLHPSPVKSVANKKRDLFRGPFFVVVVACFTRSLLRLVPLRPLPFGRLCWPVLRPVPGLRSKCRIS